MTDTITGAAPTPSTTATHEVSRRDLLRGATVAAGGAALLIGTAQPAAAKMPQKASQYQAKPKGAQSCANCTHFEPPASCGLVAGPISPHGWCRFYLKS